MFDFENRINSIPTDKTGTNIGVTGHRFGLDKVSIRNGINQALFDIGQNYPAPYKVISPLAEGADCLVAQAALHQLHAQIKVVLPLPLDVYRKDFSSEGAWNMFCDLRALASCIVQIPPQESPEKAYLLAGEYVLDHCQVLVAVWDGLPPRGLGGTGQIVEMAYKRNIPLYWVPVAARMK